MSNILSTSLSEKKVANIFRNIKKAKAYELVDLLTRVYKPLPKPIDIENIRKWMDEYPEIWRVVFDISNVIENNLIDGVRPEQAVQWAIRKNAEEIRAGLGFEGATLMEQLLINNIVVSWLRVQWTEYRLILYMGQDEKWMSEIEFWEKRLNVAQHRFLRASETLEKIRKLSAKNPTLQVNIAGQGGQQVNIAGDIVKK